MAALAADTQPVNGVKGVTTYSFKVKNSQIVYTGGLQALAAGYLKPVAAAAGEIPVGRLEPSPDPTNLGVTPLTGNTSGTPVPEGTISLDSEILLNVPVAGVSAITSVGALVFLSTDNLSADLTLTRPSRGLPIGKIVRWYSGTKCDVLRFAVGTLDAIALGGSGADAKLVLANAITDFTSADFTVLTPPYACTIRSISATVIKACTTGATGSITFQPKIGSTLVTGGVVTVNTTPSTGGSAGDVCAGTAITTSTAVLAESSTLKITATLTSTFTAGSVAIYVVFDRLLGV